MPHHPVAAAAAAAAAVAAAAARSIAADCPSKPTTSPRTQTRVVLMVVHLLGPRIALATLQVHSLCPCVDRVVQLLLLTCNISTF